MFLYQGFLSWKSLRSCHWEYRSQSADFNTHFIRSISTDWVWKRRVMILDFIWHNPQMIHKLNIRTLHNMITSTFVHVHSIKLISSHVFLPVTTTHMVLSYWVTCFMKQILFFLDNLSTHQQGKTDCPLHESMNMLKCTVLCADICLASFPIVNMTISFHHFTLDCSITNNNLDIIIHTSCTGCPKRVDIEWYCNKETKFYFGPTVKDIVGSFYPIWEEINSILVKLWKL